MHIQGMQGLGDNIYQRAFIKSLKGAIYLQTPWPQIYQDLPNVHPVAPTTSLRTQLKNAEKFTEWEKPQGRTIRAHYGSRPIFAGLERALGAAPSQMDLPGFESSPVGGDYIVVRPVTLRKEWMASARNCYQEYIKEAVNAAHKAGYKTISVADLEPGKEWAVDPPECDEIYHKGEFSVTELMSLVAGARGVMSPIGWTVPAVMATKTPALIICGGQGGYNHPSRLTDSRIDSSMIEWAVPDNFCTCTKRDHNCDKRISGLEKHIGLFLDRISP